MPSPFFFIFFCTHNALQLHEPTHFQSRLTPAETCNLSSHSLPASSIDRQEKTNWTVTRLVDTASPLCALHLRELSKLSTAFSFFFFNSPTILLPPTHKLPRPRTVLFCAHALAGADASLRALHWAIRRKQRSLQITSGQLASVDSDQRCRTDSVSTELHCWPFSVSVRVVFFPSGFFGEGMSICFDVSIGCSVIVPVWLHLVSLRPYLQVIGALPGPRTPSDTEIITVSVLFCLLWTGWWAR